MSSHRLHPARLGLTAGIAALIGILNIGPVAAQSDAAFYHEKNLTLIIGSGASGEYNTEGRVVARFMGKFVPGNPTIIVQNMPGASGIKSANYLYAGAPTDGSVIGLFNKSMAIYQAIGVENTRYKSDEFNWLGSVGHTNALVIVAAKKNVRTIADAMKEPVIVGSTSASGSMTYYPVLLNNTLGTKFKVVLGYTTGQDVDLAMERGEVDGRGGYSWTDLKRTRADWLEKKEVNILLQFGLTKETDLPNVPLVGELARNDKERAIFEFICSDIPLGRPFLAPPKVPAARVEILRKAFDATMADPEFRAEAQRLTLDVSPTKGTELDRLIKKTTSTPPDVVEAAKQLIVRE
jgi:tripartite-type tricarboxylate transporter receptor subunit TctC